MTKGFCKVEGMRELEDQMRILLTRATARNTARRALVAGANIIVSSAQAKAPEDTGRLRRAIIHSPRAKRADAGAQVYGEVLRAGGNQFEARAAARAANRAASGSVLHYVGVDARTGTGIFQEFGTRKHPAQPFLRPAFMQTQEQVLQAIAAALRVEVSKAVGRAQRRSRRGR